jgi:hypothetical protein
MIKSSILSRPVLLWKVVLLVLFVLAHAAPSIQALADAAPPPDPTVGGAVPYQPAKTNVQMLSETVTIDVPAQASTEEPKQIHVRASFTMRNQGVAAETMQVIFPLTRLNFWTTEEALYRVDLDSFVVKVDGQAASLTQISTPPELTGSDIDHGYVAEVQWAAFDAAFPVGQDVLLEVEYSMLNEYGNNGGPATGFTGISYILETGAGWHGNIGAAEITVRLPYPASEEAIIQANPGYVLSGDEIRWELRNFEPSRKDNLEVHVIHSATWGAVLELRAALEKNPGDADAWAELGDRYMSLGIDTGHQSVATISPYFAELALQARRKVVELQPDSAEAHFKLAQALWLGNPTVQRWLILGETGQAPAPSLEGPSIQEAVHELQFARSLGSIEMIPAIYTAFPDQKLAPPFTPTPTMMAQRETLAPAPAEGALAAAPPQPVKLASATPVPPQAAADAPLWLLIAASIGLVIVSGVYLYLYRSRRRRRK